MSTDAGLVQGVDFVPLHTRDIDTAVGFYGDTLGLTRSVYIPERNYAEFETGNLTLSLISPQAIGIDYHVNRNAIALHVDDVEQARARLQDRGVGRPEGRREGSLPWVPRGSGLTGPIRPGAGNPTHQNSSRAAWCSRRHLRVSCLRVSCLFTRRAICTSPTRSPSSGFLHRSGA